MFNYLSSIRYNPAERLTLLSDDWLASQTHALQVKSLHSRFQLILERLEA